MKTTARYRGYFLFRNLLLIVAFAIGASILRVSQAQTTQPATTTAGAALASVAATQPTISPAAADVLDHVAAAYKAFAAGKIAGTMQGDFDIDGRKETHHAAMDSTFSGHLFHLQLHDLNPDAAARKDELVGSTGTQSYILTSENQYAAFDLQKDQAGLEGMGPVRQIVSGGNMSLLLALSGDAAGLLRTKVNSIDRIADVTIDSQPCPTLKFQSTDSQLVTDNQLLSDTTLSFDPKTWLLRRATVDLTKFIVAQGGEQVKRANLVFDFTNTPTDPIPAKEFAWAPPAGARDIRKQATKDTAVDEQLAHVLNKPAPDFELPGLDGTAIKLSSLRGSVVVIDFWATWCGPCVGALPHLDAIYKDLGPKGLKVFAINLGEDHDTVKKFVEDTNLHVPVLLDTERKAGNDYGVSGIPFVLIIGRDGIVKDGILGFGPEEMERSKIVAVLQNSK